MSLTNKSMYAILGILDLSPCSGYDIKKYTDQVLSGFWNENFGHIYPTLKKLLEGEMIQVVPGEEGEKKVRYEITKKGQNELNNWLHEATSAQPVRSEFMLKFFFSSSQPTENVLNMLYEKKLSYEKELVMYQGLYDSLLEQPAIASERVAFYRAVLRKGIISCEGNIKWCDETVASLS